MMSNFIRIVSIDFGNSQVKAEMLTHRDELEETTDKLVRNGDFKRVVFDTLISERDALTDSKGKPSSNEYTYRINGQHYTISESGESDAAIAGSEFIRMKGHDYVGLRALAYEALKRLGVEGGEEVLLSVNLPLEDMRDEKGFIREGVVEDRKECLKSKSSDQSYPARGLPQITDVIVSSECYSTFISSVITMPEYPAKECKEKHIPRGMLRLVVNIGGGTTDYALFSGMSILPGFQTKNLGGITIASDLGAILKDKFNISGKINPHVLDNLIREKYKNDKLKKEDPSKANPVEYYDRSAGKEVDISDEIEQAFEKNINELVGEIKLAYGKKIADIDFVVIAGQLAEEIKPFFEKHFKGQVKTHEDPIFAEARGQTIAAYFPDGKYDLYLSAVDQIYAKQEAGEGDKVQNLAESKEAEVEDNV